MSLKGKNSIFETGDQHYNVDPGTIRPIGDRLLIEDITEEPKIGSILLPVDLGVGKNGQYRWGRVLAAGLGDRWLDCGWPSGALEPKLKALKTPSGRLECECKPGDKVIFERRRDEQIFIEDKTYYLVHEEQAVIGVIAD